MTKITVLGGGQQKRRGRMGQQANNNIDIEQQLKDLRPQIELLRNEKLVLHEKLIQTRVGLDTLNYDKDKKLDNV